VSPSTGKDWVVNSSTHSLLQLPPACMSNCEVFQLPPIVSVTMLLKVAVQELLPTDT
jgi:hypothetical protein